MRSGKKIRKGLLGLAILLTMTLQMTFATEVQAADGYTYTVTFYAGNHGTFAGGQDMMKITGLHYGDTVHLDAFAGFTAVSLENNSKYYVQGVRQSGGDTSTEVSSEWVKVTGDVDYVVAYGIKGSQVAYTVNYQDASGNELAPSRTFYGNVGDKPVVAYQYIEGYQPQAYNLAKTLSANEADNVFTFIYSPAENGTVTTIIGANNVTVVTQAAATPAGTAAGTAGAAGGTAGGTTPGGTTQGTAEGQGTVEVPPENTPQELVDLDDEEVPKADIKAERDKSVAPIVYNIIIAVLAIAALVGTRVYFKKHGKKNN
ncbi:hypothetical protein HGO97_021410 [Faecalicatena sp. AGMB00832]|uniref:MucBP domain-containing protein n=1 Tax=Faecalicatena faecalis TaxID=2726362 RepID=A0ABS6DAY2_9FIRM|nr:MucBP domain-containing protein [Faecalicatena faecalis]MBU3878365.1 hypothetical protein [Faecalicatena faecalis]